MFDFVGKRKIFMGISLAIMTVGLIFFLMFGLNLDIQFEGGTVMQVNTGTVDFASAEIQTVVQDTVGKSASSIQKLTGSENGDKINIILLKFTKSSALTQGETQQLVAALKTHLGSDDLDVSYETVEPFIGRELLNKGLLATLIASILIFLYVWWRFSVMSGIPAAVTALIALLHDSLIMLSFYAIFRLPVNEAFIAAILTVLGYSMNDTIVVYDRVRENRILIRKAHTYELMNRSIQQSLPRSINTVVSTLIAVITIYIFASIFNINSLKEFTLPLMVGFIAGVYSSIFIAGPLWAVWKERQENSRPAGKKQLKRA
ncbi:MAG TPA: protein translocase subunit SecF [Clostridiales bacterium]|nr:protein translocase subunit SecF [Clostridiales bacterium]